MRYGKGTGKSILEWAEKAKQGVDEVVQASVLELCNSCILLTPVGNPDLWKSKPPPGYVGGRARANWFASINLPDSTTSEKVWSKGGEQIVKNKLSKAVGEASGNVFYLTNNLPYILPLEYQGWSTQAPVGMARQSVLQFEKNLKNAISKLK